jgi:DNA topoisomerase-1
VEETTGLSLDKVPEPPYSLVVCEKPAVALRIAQALGTSSSAKISRLEKGKGPERPGRGLNPTFFCVTDRNGQKYVVCSAVGHLYGLVDQNGKRSEYPIFDVKWLPISNRSLRAHITTVSERNIRLISLLSRNATKFIHACDYDQEGEVIGYNILQYACNNKYEQSLRAKFSTLTDSEILNSFDSLLNPSKTLAEAGRTRHLIDFIYGINLSRALTQSFKKSNNGKRYRNLSMGRVQGPALAFVVDRELAITNHVPVPYWTLSAEFEKEGYIIKADYHVQKINALSKAASIVDECTGLDGQVAEVKHQRVTLNAPYPFDLGDLQKEAYRVFRYSPSYTLSVAERLYINALISYPRTSSQKLPKGIDYRKIILDLSKIGSLFSEGHAKSADRSTSLNTSHYLITEQARDLLRKDHPLSPNEGSKSDPAHPAIYPTGHRPKGRLDAAELKVFDLIVRRFLSTFGQPVIFQDTAVTIRVTKDHIFKVNEKKIRDQGWLRLYEPYVNRIGLETPLCKLPILHNGDILKNKGVTMTKKYTQPPQRFNQASLLEEMEKQKIGTKATRSDIISTLFKRDYISNRTISTIITPSQRQNTRIGKGIEATAIGVEIVQIMRKYLPNLVSTNFTRDMEEQLEAIESGKAGTSNVINFAIAKLREAIVPVKEQEIEIGNQITRGVNITMQKQQIVVGNCPICSKGDLKIKRSNRTKKRFVGCSNFLAGACKASAPLPQRGIIRSKGEVCSICRWPIIETIYSGRTRYSRQACINTQCPSNTK